MKFLLSTVITSLLLSNVEARWKPTPGLTWNYVIGDDKFNVNSEKAQVIDVDYELSNSKIKEFHNAGKKVICYFSVGTIEKWRDDFKDFKAISGLVKNEYDDWPGEYWLDYRVEGIKPLIKNRMKVAVSKNCDGIEVDNLDGYSVNKNHWDLKESDAVQFAKWLGNTAHELGISIGLKNIPGLIDTLESYYDFAINESCVNHSKECSYYKKFINNGKAVFGITYGNLNDKLPTLCNALNGIGISMIVKSSQNLKQAGWTFDGKSQCGSNFSSGISSSNSSNSVKKTTIVQTTVKKTTTLVQNPTPVVQKPTVSNSSVAKNNATSNSTTSKAASSNSVISSAAASNASSKESSKVASKVVSNASSNAVSNKISNATSNASSNAVSNAISNDATTNSTNNIVSNPTSKPANNDIPVVKDNTNNKEVPSTINNKIEETENIINSQFDDEKEGGSGSVVTGVAVTGSIVGAAAAFVFVKKNPKKYNQLKRSISRRATSVKRGASTVKRRLTSKKSKTTPNLPVTNDPAAININDNQYSTYRYQFTQNFDL